jgi:O-methyltransferase involved in polyketide biosynthesis
MKKSYQKISPTAKFVAYLRTFTDIPFAKEIAAESGAEKTFQELSSGSTESIVRFAPLWEARYKATDRIIAQHSITQVLEVAAGLSSRGLAMTENPDVVYVVTDLPQILEQEEAIARAILARLNSRRPNLYFQAANALDRESLSRAATPFKPNRPLAIITEGLLPYFSRGEKEALAGNIHKLLEKYGGIWITSDVHTKQFRKEVSQVEENVVQQRQSKISSITGSNLESNLFADENDIQQFFNKAGFTIEEYPQSNIYEDLSSVKILNLDGEEILKIQLVLKLNKTLILTPRNT